MSEHVIKLDAPRFCPHCCSIVTHACTVYVDAEYTVCFRCKTRTTRAPGEGEMQVTEMRKRDPGKLADDLHRGTPRRYLTRRILEGL